MNKIIYLRRVLLGLDNDPLGLYEEKLISLLNEKIKDGTIDSYMNEICEVLSEDEQTDMLCYVLSCDIDIFQPWYVKALKKNLNDKHAKKSCYTRLKNIYNLYEKQFDDVKY